MSCRATSVVLLLGLALAVAEGDLYEGYSLGSSCLPGHPCILAFISENPMILHCPRVYFRDHVSWQYLDPAWVQEQPATFQCSRGSFSPVLIHAKLQRLHFKSQLLAGNLYILSPSVEDSGLYTCSAGDATIAYYHVDFQDAGYIHVSHAKLGEATLDNTTVKLASGDVATLFTSWSPWQACDRCSQPGERKQVGYCYVQVTGKDHQLKKPLPCGMARRKHPTLPWRGPELRVETCQVPCAASFLLGQDKPNVELPLVFATYHPQLKAHLHCPASSIYSPVYWQEGPTSLTRLGLLQKNSSQSLDKATGGGILHLSFQNDLHSEFYNCYVSGHLAGKFLVASPGSMALSGELSHTYLVIEALVVGLSIFLVFLMFLSIIQSCRRKPGTTMV
ncbi:protein FAM187B [Varanus komodoensis]|uniref:protein FAM187B n=1 Tax=Varanus komodoensis TaxID=61221 RepID=UPI001CF7D87D|nr:protein FAM187B [Varanus komodoensis]